jgi:hypothetical protein
MYICEETSNELETTIVSHCIDVAYYAFFFLLLLFFYMSFVLGSSFFIPFMLYRCYNILSFNISRSLKNGCEERKKSERALLLKFVFLH